MSFGTDVWWLLVLAVGAGLSIIGFFLKGTLHTQDSHGEEIEHIKRSYVTKEELREVKTELKQGLKKTQSDVEEIKERMLTKDEFYRTQNQTEAKIDKIYDLLISRGGQLRAGCIKEENI